MNGILENLPAASSFDGRSGMRPSGPSITGTNKNGSGKDAATCSQEARSDTVSTLCMHAKVSPAVAFAHAGTSETKASQTTSRRDALKKDSVPADPDSIICVARCVRAREMRFERSYCFLLMGPVMKA